MIVQEDHNVFFVFDGSSRDLHTYVHDDVLPQARNDPNVPYDVPLLVVSGVRQLHHGATTEWFKDDSVLFAEPQNPVLVALAKQMHLAVSNQTQADYDFHQRFTKALHVYSSPALNGELARSVVVLPPCCAGAIDADGALLKIDGVEIGKRRCELLFSECLVWVSFLVLQAAR